MMMSCLAAGGMDTVKSEIRDQFGKHHSDSHYQVNASGLYEPDVREMRDPTWPRQYDEKAIKVVVPFLPNLTVHQYRVIFMRRDLEEVRQSFEAAFGGKMKLAELEQQVHLALERLSNRKDTELVQVQYSDVLTAPLQEFRKLRDYGWPIDPVAAAALVDPSQYRFRRELLEVGI